MEDLEKEIKVEEKEVAEEKIVEEPVENTPRRGRPRKIELPETSTTGIEDIISVEEVVVEQKLEDETTTNPTETKKHEETQISKPEVVEELPKRVVHTAQYLFTKGEEVYLVHFSGKSEENLFSRIDEKYIFRPLKTKVKEVLINEDNSISYRLDACQGCFLEKLVTKGLEECQRICDFKNNR